MLNLLVNGSLTSEFPPLYISFAEYKRTAETKTI